MRNARLRVVERESSSNFSDLGFSNICVNSMTFKIYLRDLKGSVIPEEPVSPLYEIFLWQESARDNDRKRGFGRFWHWNDLLALGSIYLFQSFFFSCFFSYRYNKHSKYKAPLPYYSVILPLGTVGCFLFQIPTPPPPHTAHRGRGSFLKHLALPACLLPTCFPQHWFSS